MGEFHKPPEGINLGGAQTGVSRNRTSLAGGNERNAEDTRL